MSDPAHEVMGQTHEVYVLCRCGDIEACRMERYVSDIRILQKELRDAIEQTLVDKVGSAR